MASKFREEDEIERFLSKSEGREEKIVKQMMMVLLMSSVEEKPHNLSIHTASGYTQIYLSGAGAPLCLCATLHGKDG